MIYYNEIALTSDRRIDGFDKSCNCIFECGFMQVNSIIILNIVYGTNVSIRKKKCNSLDILQVIKQLKQLLLKYEELA